MGSQSRVGDGTNRKMKVQILGLIFVGLLPFLVSGAAKPNDGHIMRFGRSEGDQIDEESRHIMRFGRSVMDQNDMFMRALRSGRAGMLMRALRSSDMLMRALRSDNGMARDLRGFGGSSNDMFMRALREDPSIMSDAIENADN